MLALIRQCFGSFFRHLFHFLSEEEKKVVKSLGYKVLCDLQAGMINSSGVLVASIMLQNLQGLHFGMFGVSERCQCGNKSNTFFHGLYNVLLSP